MHSGGNMNRQEIINCIKQVRNPEQFKKLREQLKSEKEALRQIAKDKNQENRTRAIAHSILLEKTVFADKAPFPDNSFIFSDSNVTISGGEFGYYTGHSQSGTFTISDGKFRDFTGHSQSGAFTISGGEFRDLTGHFQSGTFTISD